MKKLIYLVVLLVAGGGGYYYYQSQQAPQVPEFMKVTVSEGDVVEVVQATGTLQANRIVAVGSKVSGVIDELNTDFNQVVRAGQVLAKVNTDLLETQVRIQEANIARQEVDLANQRVQLEDSQRSFERTKELFAKQLVTQQALEAAELQVKSRQAQIASAEKSMISAQVNLDQARLNVTEATIKSPIDGVVINRVVDRGQTVVGSQSATKFFDIATDLTTLKLEGGVDEAEIGKVRTGMTVRFTVDAYPNQNFEGRITMVRLNPTTQQNVVTYTTVAEIPNPDLRLRPGMTASMRIEVSRRDGVMRIPSAALRFRPTNDMWTALGQEPPTPAGRGGRAGGSGSGSASGQPSGQASGTAAPAAAPASAPQAQGQQARGGNGSGQANPFGGGREGGRQGMGSGQGGRGGFGGMTLTPEQQKAMEAIRQLPADQRAAAMARAGIQMGNFGGGRGGGQGRGGRNGGQAAAPVELQAGRSIDESFAPIVRSSTRGQVYILEPATATNKYGTLKRLDVQVGITDGTFTELVQGPADLKVGTELITNILMPWLTTTTTAAGAASPFNQNQGRGGMQGMQGFGGAPAGGGGGGRGGGGR
jgi:HlyD family secretion protein